MIIFERRQRVFDFLREQPGIKVTELAKLLDVSEGTIRNDLNALEEGGQLTRVRGGAVLRTGRPGCNPAFAARIQVNAAAKRRIARWAADTVEDGDSILLDASTTVFHMVPFLQKLRNLTIVTNGIEIALSLAENPSHTIILVGGILRTDSISTIGHLGERMLEDLHVKTAFASCTGFSIEAGLTQVDIQEAQLKSRMMRSARRLVALIDSSKFGQADLTPFASLEQIMHIFTDSDVEPRFIEPLRQTHVVLTVCDENTVSTFTPHGKEAKHYRVGFANLTEQDPFPIDVRRGLERAAQEVGNIDLVLADNQLSGEVALEVAERFAAQDLDLVIEYQIDEQVGRRIMDRFRQTGVPVIAVDIPMVGATFFGVDNYRAGHMAGVALGHWLKAVWEGRFDWLIVLEEPRAGALVAARIQGQLDGLQSVIGEISAEKWLRLNSGNTSEISEAETAAALEQIPDARRIAVVCFNDDAAIGALTAARKLRRESDVAIVGQGADRRVREELRRPGSRIIGSTAYEPGKYGEKLIPLALKIMRGEPVPPAVYSEHTFIHATQATSDTTLRVSDDISHRR